MSLDSSTISSCTRRVDGMSDSERDPLQLVRLFANHPTFSENEALRGVQALMELTADFSIVEALVHDTLRCTQALTSPQPPARPLSLPLCSGEAGGRRSSRK